MPRVVLVNPAVCTTGYSFFTPRWLYVLAGATPTEVCGDPVLVDETLARFRATMVRPGDIVGIGISSGNCTAGYRVLREAKTRGATVIMGGIHCTIFPDEALRMGADAVVTGNGDTIWSRVVKDAFSGKLAPRYDGGRVAGEALQKARWDLIDPSKYMFATVQTVAGCPENCSFCSVWVTDGRQPRLRLADQIVAEVMELRGLGFRQIAFADDNFTPATLGRIAREPSPERRRQLDMVRQERLRFFDEYGRRVPRDVFAMTQMTAEVVSDDDYLTAMHDKMRIRAALIGVESFSEEGLEAANKKWNPAGQQMVETIRRIQDRGILVLSSIICGLESDTVETIRGMRRFAIDSGTLLAQFTFYNPFPGTKDYYELVNDRKNRHKHGFIARHRFELLEDEFWLKPLSHLDIIRHPALPRDQWAEENRRCWDAFYSLRESIRRVRRGWACTWPLAGKITYIFACLAFRRVYGGNGLSADAVNRRKLSFSTRWLIRTGVVIYGHFFRQKRVSLRVSLAPIRTGGSAAGAADMDPLYQIGSRSVDDS
jgi:radical SAM superfamily enzyme YgiQ (UPF0313 family)